MRESTPARRPAFTPADRDAGLEYRDSPMPLGLGRVAGDLGLHPGDHEFGEFRRDRSCGRQPDLEATSVVRALTSFDPIVPLEPVQDARQGRSMQPEFAADFPRCAAVIPKDGVEDQGLDRVETVVPGRHLEPSSDRMMSPMNRRDDPGVMRRGSVLWPSIVELIE
jgi:hypothetical protein